MDTLLELTVFASRFQLLATFVVVLAAQTIYAFSGFGAGILSVACLAFVFPDLSHVVALLLLLSLPVELFVVLRNRSDVPARLIGTLLLGIAVGIVIGTTILKAGTGRTWLLTLLGLVVLTFAFYYLRNPTPGTERRSLFPGTTTIVGGLSGILAGMFGTGGPPVILYFRSLNMPKSQFRAALLCVFLISGVVRIPVYLTAGFLSGSLVRSALVVLPASLAGLYLGSRLHGRVREETFRKATAALLAVLGVLLLLRN